jgi:hypothetical protein
MAVGAPSFTIMKAYLCTLTGDILRVLSDNVSVSSLE